MATEAAAVPAEVPSTAPAKAGLVLATLIVASAVANLPHGHGERRAAVHRRILRRLADAAQPGRGRLLSGPGLLGAVAGRAGRPLRPQDDAAPRPDAGHTRRVGRRLRAVDRDPDRRTHLRRFRRRHGVSHLSRLDRGAVGRPGPHPVDRTVGGHWRRHQRVGPPDLRDPVVGPALECRLPGGHSGGAGRPLPGPEKHPGARQ